MKNKKYKALLINKYDAYSLEVSGVKKKAIQFEIIRILESVKNPDSEDFYIWGLTFYMAGEVKENNLRLALEKFGKAVELDKDNFLAILYAGHCYHDKKAFKKALFYYEAVNVNRLKEFRIWRFVKLIEQIGYCKYKLGRIKEGRESFEEVLKWYEKMEFDELAVPSELLECLDDSDPIVVRIKEIEDYLN